MPVLPSANRHRLAGENVERRRGPSPEHRTGSRIGFAAEGIMIRRREAEEWQREKAAELQARIRIEEALLRSYRTELADLRQLRGRDLAERYGCESPAEVERALENRRAFLDGIEELAVEAEKQGRPDGLLGVLECIKY